MELDTYYNFLRLSHIIFMTTWMSGLFYLPRLFVYHSSATKNSKQYKTFIIMEKKLYSFIMNPSLFLTWFFGLWLVYITEVHGEVWLKIKFLLVVIMTIFHIYCGKMIKEFAKSANTKNEKYFRIINEIPTIIFIAIIYLVVFKP